MTSSELNPERATAERFLSHWGISIEELANYVRVSSATTVLLAGSIPAGLATEDSDIDLLILGEGQLDDEGVFHEATCKVSTKRRPDGIMVNLELWDPQQITSLKERFRSCVEMLTQPGDDKKLVSMSLPEQRMLHRVRVGVPIVQPDVADRIRDEFQLAYLPLQLLAQNLMLAYSLREDAIAQLRINQPQSALWMLRFSMQALASAVLASIGETTPSPKWVTRLLLENRDDLGGELVDGMLTFLFPNPNADAMSVLGSALKFADTVVSDIMRYMPEIYPLMKFVIDRFRARTSLKE